MGFQFILKQTIPRNYRFIEKRFTNIIRFRFLEIINPSKNRSSEIVDSRKSISRKKSLEIETFPEHVYQPIQ